MLLGVLIGRKSYTMLKYIFVSIVIVGVILFSFKEKYDKKDGEDPLLGLIFISVSLLSDGFLGAFEDRMRSVKRPTSLNLMFFLNFYNSIYLIVALILTNEGTEFVKFCSRHPIVIRDLSVVVLVAIFGQFCITSVVTNFGALPVSIITTIRKFVTVLLSVIIFNNVLSIRQWIAASIIFTALFLDGYFSRKAKEKVMRADNTKVDNDIEVINEKADVTKM
jgi:UDP-galactose transporter B1